MIYSVPRHTTCAFNRAYSRRQPARYHALSVQHQLCLSILDDPTPPEADVHAVLMQPGQIGHLLGASEGVVSTAVGLHQRAAERLQRLLSCWQPK